MLAKRSDLYFMLCLMLLHVFPFLIPGYACIASPINIKSRSIKLISAIIVCQKVIVKPLMQPPRTTEWTLLVIFLNYELPLFIRAIDESDVFRVGSLY